MNLELRPPKIKTSLQQFRASGTDFVITHKPDAYAFESLTGRDPCRLLSRPLRKHPTGALRVYQFNDRYLYLECFPAGIYRAVLGRREKFGFLREVEEALFNHFAA